MPNLGISTDDHTIGRVGQALALTRGQGLCPLASRKDTMTEALTALAKHCGLPGLTDLGLPIGQPAPGLIAFRYKTGDSHIRRFDKQGLTGWQGWNKGALGKQLWALKPEGQVQAVLLVEGETSAVCAHFALKDKGWLVIATSGSSFPEADSRNKVITALQVPVILWPDPDLPGQQKWLPEGLSWLSAVNPAVYEHKEDYDNKEDLRGWWLTNKQRYGLEETVLTIPDKIQCLTCNKQASLPDSINCHCFPKRIETLTTKQGKTSSMSDTLHNMLLALWEHHYQTRDYDPVRFVPKKFNTGTAKDKAPSLDTLLPKIHAKPSRQPNKWHCGNTSNHQHGDRNPSMSVNLDKQVFHCFVCADRYNPTASGDNVSLAAYLEGLPVDDYLRQRTIDSKASARLADETEDPLVGMG